MEIKEERERERERRRWTTRDGPPASSAGINAE